MDKYFIIAGEESGDQHGGKLIDAINKINKSEYIGIGGPNMIRRGFVSLFPIEKMSVMGFVEIIKHIRFFIKVKKIVLFNIKREKPKAVILIDYPGFNLRIAKKIKSTTNIPIIYYISPQIWAWRESRIKYIRRYVDKLLVIFPFERKWYANRNIKVKWVGHPLLDNSNTMSKEQAKYSLGLNCNDICISLFPGSRKQELHNHLEILIESAKEISKTINNVKVIINFSTRSQIEKQLPDNIIVTNNKQKEVFLASTIAIIASGTATIEAAIYGTPMVVVYKMNLVSWIISKLLVKTQFTAMPNIIAKKQIVAELIQNEVNKSSITKHALLLLQDKRINQKCIMELNKIRESLINGNASDNVATIIKNL